MKLQEKISGEKSFSAQKRELMKDYDGVLA